MKRRMCWDRVHENKKMRDSGSESFDSFCGDGITPGKDRPFPCWKSKHKPQPIEIPEDFVITKVKTGKRTIFPY